MYGKISLTYALFWKHWCIPQKSQMFGLRSWAIAAAASAWAEMCSQVISPFNVGEGHVTARWRHQTCPGKDLSYSTLVTSWLSAVFSRPLQLFQTPASWFSACFFLKHICLWSFRHCWWCQQQHELTCNILLMPIAGTLCCWMDQLLVRSIGMSGTMFSQWSNPQIQVRWRQCCRCFVMFRDEMKFLACARTQWRGEFGEVAWQQKLQTSGCWKGLVKTPVPKCKFFKFSCTFTSLLISTQCHLWTWHQHPG